MKLNKAEFILMNNPIRGFVQEMVEIKPFLDFEKKVEGGKVLEIGCGNGNGIRLIEKYFKPKEIYGIDLDPKMIDIAKKRFAEKFVFRVADATQLKFSDNCFDGIFDFGVVHHIPNWRKGIDEMHRVLRKGGQIFIEDLSIESFDISFGKIFRKVLDHPYESMYARKEFVEYIEKVGFKIIKNEVRQPLGLINYFVIVAEK